MAEEKKDYTTLIIAGVLGVVFVGFQQTQKNEANNIGNLPATNANVEANSNAIADLREQLEADLKAEANLIRSEISRRETETIKYVDTLDNKMERHVERIEHRLTRDEDILMNHMMSPPPQHTIDFGE